MRTLLVLFLLFLATPACACYYPYIDFSYDNYWSNGDGTYSLTLSYENTAYYDIDVNDVQLWFYGNYSFDPGSYISEYLSRDAGSQTIQITDWTGDRFGFYSEGGDWLHVSLDDIHRVEAPPVPLPAAVWFAGVGMAGMAYYRRRKGKSQEPQDA